MTLWECKLVHICEDNLVTSTLKNTDAFCPNKLLLEMCDN